MKLYTIYMAKLNELNVRETNKMYIAEGNLRNLAFGGGIRFLKDEYATTPAGAYEKKIEELERDLQYSKEYTHKINSALGYMRKEAKKYAKKER